MKAMKSLLPIFLLILAPAVFAAFPYYTVDGNFNKTGNETFDTDPIMAINFTVGNTSAGEVSLDNAGTSTPQYVHKLGLGLYAEEFRLKLNTVADLCYVAGWSDVNGTTSAVFSLRYDSAGGLLNLREEKSFGTLIPLTGVTADGTANQIKLVRNLTWMYAYVNDTYIGGAETTVNTTFFKWSRTPLTPAGSCGFTADNWVSYNGTQYTSLEGVPVVDPITMTFNLNAIDAYDVASIQNITVNVSNSSNHYVFTTGNGTVLIENGTISAFNSTYNVTFTSNQSGGYLTSLESFNLTDGGSYTGTIHQSIIYITAKEKITNTPLGEFFVKVGTQSNQSYPNSAEPEVTCGLGAICNGTAQILIRAGTFNVSVNRTGWLNASANFTTVPLQTSNVEVELATHRFKVNATAILTGAPITSFTATIEGINITYTEEKNSSNNEVSFDLVNGIYNISFVSDDFEASEYTVYLNGTPNLVNDTLELYTLNSVNVSVFDEILGDDNTFFFNRTVFIDFISDDFSNNYSTNNGSFFVDLLSPGAYEIRYRSTDYKERSYFFQLDNRTHNDIKLYLLSLGNSTDVTVTVQDGSGNTIQGAEVRLKRYYVDDNAYSVVAMGKTDFSGQAIFDVDFDDAFYQIKGISGSDSIETSGSKIFSTSLTITIVGTSDPFTDIDLTNEIQTSLTFNNVTQTFSYSFADASGLSRLGTIEVYEQKGTGNTLVCSNSAFSSDSTVMCTVNVSNSNSSFQVNGYISAVNGSIRLLTDTYETLAGLQESFIQKVGGNGLFMAIIFAGTAAGLGLASPAISIVLFLAGLMAMVVMGMSALTWTVYITISIFGFMVIWRLKN